MESEFNFIIKSGAEASVLVDKFYESDNHSSRAKQTDTFLIAMNENQVVGSVRLCQENEVYLLRSMLIHPDFRKQGLGKKLIREFDKQLLKNLIGPVYCLPHSYLENFYSLIGFKIDKSKSAPSFLQDRIIEYRKKGLDCILMMKQ